MMAVIRYRAFRYLGNAREGRRRQHHELSDRW